MIITIDGPVASGKSTVAQRLARRLGYYYLNTGLLYRAIAYLLHKSGRVITPEAMASVTAQDCVGIRDMMYSYTHGKASLHYKGRDITEQLYNPQRDQDASIVSASPLVRQALLDFQRSFAQTHDVVADGRDCGTVVFPNATVKFFLTADTQTRAQRLIDSGRHYTGMALDQVVALVQERDTRDRSRAIAPLIVPDNACTIDSSEMSIDQVVDAMLQAVPSHKE